MTQPICQSCGKSFPIHLLDGKPERLRHGHQFDQLAELSKAGDTGEQFEWLEGPCCYGPGYNAESTLFERGAQA